MARRALGRHCSKLLGKEDRIITCWRFGSSSLTSWHPTPSLFRLHLNSAVSIQSSPLLGDWQTNKKMPRQPDFFFFLYHSEPGVSCRRTLCRLVWDGWRRRRTAPTLSFDCSIGAALRVSAIHWPETRTFEWPCGIPVSSQLCRKGTGFAARADGDNGIKTLGERD